MYNNLMSRNNRDEVDLDHSLTETFEVPDDTTIVYNLRKGVQFHDGNDFTSEDVVWNFNYLTDPDVASVSAASYEVVEKIDAPDDFTVIHNLARPFFDLIAQLSDRGGQILSPRAKERLGDEFGSQPVGTGAFVFDQLASGSFVKMKKNPNYWRKDANGDANPLRGRADDHYRPRRHSETRPH